MAEGAHPPKIREYRLALRVDVKSGEFGGAVEVELEEPQTELWLDADGIDVEPASPRVTVEKGTAARIIRVRTDAPSKVFPLRFRGAVPERSLIGLYWSRYGDGRILTSQCAPTGVRRIFPCVDRPDRRAIVRLTLTVDREVTPIFNTPVLETADIGDRRRYVFEPTPPMPPYLFYLAVGRFESIGRLAGAVRVNLFAPPGRSSAGQFALDRAAALLSAYEEYYRIPYPLPKLDLIAVPEHAFGAMENWGAITFRDMRLLVDPWTNALQRHETLTTIAHEIAHQWFGNLVTMEWWTDIWLNESFATLLELKMVDGLYPEAGALPDYLTYWTSAALLADALPGAQPVSVPVHTPEEISQVFDPITYGKGAAVLRMIEGHLGPDRFRAGVTTYLNRFRFSNARSADLWAALSEATGGDVAPVLNAWIVRSGHPVLDVRRDGGEVWIRQRRFSLNGHHLEATWPVPLTLRLGSELRHVLMEGPELRIPVEPATPVHANPGALGFYRTLYDPDLYEDLLGRFGTTDPLDDWSMLEDLFAFVLSGDISLYRYLQFVEAARESSAYVVVRGVTDRLTSLEPYLGHLPAFHGEINAFVRAQLDRIGLDPRAGEPDHNGILRERIATLRARTDDAFAQELADRFTQYDHLNPDLRLAVAYSFARFGDATSQRRLLDQIARAPNEGDTLRLESVLGAFPDPALIENSLGRVWEPPINRAHVVPIIHSAAVNRAGRRTTWGWLQAELPRVAAEYRGTGILPDVLSTTLPLVGLGREEEVQTYFQSHRLEGGERGLQKGLEMLSVVARVVERNG